MAERGEIIATREQPTGLRGIVEPDGVSTAEAPYDIEVHVLLTGAQLANPAITLACEWLLPDGRVWLIDRWQGGMTGPEAEPTFRAMARIFVNGLSVSRLPRGLRPRIIPLPEDDGRGGLRSRAPLLYGWREERR